MRHRTRQVGIRVTRDEHALLQRAARRRALPIGAFMRSVAVEAAREVVTAGHIADRGPRDEVPIIDDSDAKDELDAIAFLARGSWVASQGRMKFVQLVGTPAPVRHVFLMEEIIPRSMGPGYEGRIPEYRVPWQWNQQDRSYNKQRLHIHGPSVTKIGRTRLGGPEVHQLPDIVAQWIDTEELADQVGSDVITTLGSGQIQWWFDSLYPYPELEWGDVVAVETDWFVARDPNAARALAGRLFGAGPIVACNDEGTVFSVWIQSYADIFGAAQAVDRLALTPAQRVKAYHSANQSGPTGGTLALAFDSEAYDVKDLHDPSTNNSRITVSRPGQWFITANVRYTALAATAPPNSSQYQVGIRKNGTTTLKVQSLTWNAAVDGQLTLVILDQAVAGDYYEVTFTAVLTGGGSISVTINGGTEADTHFEMYLAQFR